MPDDQYVIQFTRPFIDCQRKMSNVPGASEALMSAIMEVGRQPFKNPQLETHAFKGMSARSTYISYVGGPTGWRLIWRLVNRTALMLLFGEHDIEERAKRLRLSRDPSGGIVRLVEEEGTAEPQEQVAPRRSSTAGRLFMAFTDEDLADFGFAEQHIKVLRRLDHEWELEQLEEHLPREYYERALAVYLYGNPDGDVADIDSTELALVELQASEYEQRLEAELRSADSADFAEVNPDELQLTGPIDDWMHFLTPQQRAVVDADYTGPAKVSGPAGTGKSIVALHRAARAAREGRRVLLTTFVKTVVAAHSANLDRILVDHRDRVDVINLHALAGDIITSTEGTVPNDNGAAFGHAWARARRAELAITESDRVDVAYCKDEVSRVIRGRLLTSFDDYASLNRRGRRVPLSVDERRQLWKLAEWTNQRLQETGKLDYAGMLTRALRAIEAGEWASPYDAVIVDESQDLEEVGIRLCAALAQDPAWLLLAGDGQQSIYVGGFTLKSAGVDIVGRSTILDKGHRTTEAIHQLALRMLGTDSFPSEDDGERTSGPTLEFIRQDEEDPEVAGYDDVDEHDDVIAEWVSDKAARGDAVGLLVRENTMAEAWRNRLSRSGLACNGRSWRDVPEPGIVRVGTYHSAKGLEFDAVALPRLDHEGLNLQPRHGESAEAFAERDNLLRSAIFVAATRARHRLMVAWVGEPIADFEPPPPDPNEPCRQ